MEPDDNRRSCYSVTRCRARIKEMSADEHAAARYGSIPKENPDLGSPISSTFLFHPLPCSVALPFPLRIVLIARRCRWTSLAASRGSKRGNRVTMPTRIESSSLSPLFSLLSPLSLSPLFFFSFRFAHAGHTLVFSRGGSVVWCGATLVVCGVMWCGVVRRDVASTRLDSRGGS